MHFTAATALAVLAAVQPTLATVDFHMGTSTWGGWGDVGSRLMYIMILDERDGHACDAISDVGVLKANSDKGKGEGNWNCDDCNGFRSEIKDWKPTMFETNAEKLDVDSKYVSKFAPPEIFNAHK